MICSICQTSLTAEDLRLFVIADKEIPHHQTCRSFRSSIEAGCYACNRLWAILDINERHWVTSTAENEVDSDDKQVAEASKAQHVVVATKKPITTIDARHGAGFGHAGSYLLSVSFDPGLVQPSETAQPGKPYWRLSLLLKPQGGMVDGSEETGPTQRHSPRTDSEGTLLLARKWITECEERHDQCTALRGRDSSWYPTRLLDCGSSEDARPHYRLIITKDVALSGPYMTLSHCWGRVECLSLTTQNHDSLLDGIPFDDLPQLYQDAMDVARRLGIRYLWIDSLCIIQKGDNLADWHREATLMNKVYQNSFCNISATHAPNGHYSLFSGRNPAALYPQSVNMRLDGQILPCLVLDYGFWDTEVSCAPINTRAWVFQERLLSPRVLHFGERQILWECESKDDAEIHPEGIPLDLHRSYTRFKGFASDESVKEPGSLQVYLYWAKIVSSYTSCKLTFPSDKLIALSAVAKRIMEVNGDEYLAGMWRRYLDRELIWSVSVRHASREPGADLGPTAYRAPSWSWASADGDINPGVPDVDAKDILILIKVHDLHLDYTTNDPTSMVTGGWLRLWGVLKPLLLTPHNSPTAPSPADWIMVVGGIHVSVPAESRAQEPQPHVLLDRPHADFEEQNRRLGLFCMSARVRDGDAGSIYVMLLQIVDSDKGIFQRIGMARGWGADVKQKLLARHPDEDELPCEEYRDGRHLIRII